MTPKIMASAIICGVNGVRGIIEAWGAGAGVGGRGGLTGLVEVVNTDSKVPPESPHWSLDELKQWISIGFVSPE